MKKPKKSTFVQGDQDPFVAKEALSNGEESPLAYYLADLAQGLRLLANTMHDPATEQNLHDAGIPDTPTDASSPIGLEEEQILKSDAPTEEPLSTDGDEASAAFIARGRKVIREGTEEDRDAFQEELVKINAHINEEDWEASLEQFEHAVSSGDEELVASYLRDASGILTLVSQALLRTSGAQHWKLEFKRGRGRPVDQREKILKKLAIATALRVKTAKFGKQEAAIADMTSEKGEKGEKGPSRATIYRAKPSKVTTKKAAKKSSKAAAKKPTKKKKSHKKS